MFLLLNDYSPIRFNKLEVFQMDSQPYRHIKEHSSILKNLKLAFPPSLFYPKLNQN